MGASGGMSCMTADNGDVLDVRAGTDNDQISTVVYASAAFPSGSSWANAATIRAHAGETVTIIKGMAFEGPHYLIFQDFHVLDGLWVGSTFSDGSNAGHHIRFQNLDVTKDGVNYDN